MDLRTGKDFIMKGGPQEEPCPVCGKKMLMIEVNHMGIKYLCDFCISYHTPVPCIGEGCKACEEIRFMREHNRL